MKESYLKHVTVIVIGGLAGAVALAQPQHTGNVLVVFGFILGYVFKNGYHAANGKKPSD